jgi:hypothetical protein
MKIIIQDSDLSPDSILVRTETDNQLQIIGIWGQDIKVEPDTTPGLQKVTVYYQEHCIAILSVQEVQDLRKPKEILLCRAKLS